MTTLVREFSEPGKIQYVFDVLQGADRRSELYLELVSILRDLWVSYYLIGSVKIKFKTDRIDGFFKMLETVHWIDEASCSTLCVSMVTSLDRMNRHFSSLPGNAYSTASDCEDYLSFLEHRQRIIDHIRSYFMTHRLKMSRYSSLVFYISTLHLKALMQETQTYYMMALSAVPQARLPITSVGESSRVNLALQEVPGMNQQIEDEFQRMVSSGLFRKPSVSITAWFKLMDELLKKKLQRAAKTSQEAPLNRRSLFLEEWRGQLVSSTVKLAEIDLATLGSALTVLDLAVSGTKVKLGSAIIICSQLAQELEALMAQDVSDEEGFSFSVQASQEMLNCFLKSLEYQLQNVDAGIDMKAMYDFIRCGIASRQIEQVDIALKFLYYMPYVSESFVEVTQLIRTRLKLREEVFQRSFPEFVRLLCLTIEKLLEQTLSMSLIDASYVERMRDLVDLVAEHALEVPCLDQTALLAFFQSLQPKAALFHSRKTLSQQLKRSFPRNDWSWLDGHQERKRDDLGGKLMQPVEVDKI